MAHGKSQLAADDIAALSDRSRLIERDLAVASLPAESAVARHNQPLGRNVLQRIADFTGNVLGPIRLQRSMADGTNADFLLQVVFQRFEALEILLVAILHLQRPDIALAPF